MVGCKWQYVIKIYDVCVCALVSLVRTRDQVDLVTRPVLIHATWLTACKHHQLAPRHRQTTLIIKVKRQVQVCCNAAWASEPHFTCTL